MKVSTLFAVARSVAFTAVEAGAKKLYEEFNERTKDEGITVDDLHQILVAVDDSVTSPSVAYAAASNLATIWTLVKPEQMEEGRELVKRYVDVWSADARSLELDHINLDVMVSTFKGGIKISRTANKSIVEAIGSNNLSKIGAGVLTTVRTIENFDTIVEDTVSRMDAVTQSPLKAITH